MKKSDIRNGMHVITMSDEEYVIIDNVQAREQIINNNTADIVMINVGYYHGWMDFDGYDDDLRYHKDAVYDIKEVYEPRFYSYTLSPVKEDREMFIKVWERPIPKKMTKAEIEAELGYEIEIVESED